MGERSLLPRYSSLLRDRLRGEKERRLDARLGLRERPRRGDRDLSLCCRLAMNVAIGRSVYGQRSLLVFRKSLDVGEKWLVESVV